MPQMLKQWIKKRFDDVQSAIVSLVVLALIAAFGTTIYFFSKNLMLFLIELLISPTPLWATILLVLLSCLLIYVINRRSPIYQKPPAKGSPINNNVSDDLTDEDIEILRLVSINKLTGGVYLSIDRDDIYRKTKLSSQKLQYFLDRLGASGCLKYNFQGGICGISPKGRELLFKKGLLS